LKVDYANHEVMDRGLWVNPKYRGMGLLRYTAVNRDRYLADIGVTVIRTTVDYANKTGKGVEEALGARQYGRARALKIFWLRLWKESRYNENRTQTLIRTRENKKLIISGSEGIGGSGKVT